jgi:adenylate kinase family enzyme
MTRIMVIGNAGNGKTTLCKKLGARLGIEVFHVDSLQWQPGWRRTPVEEFTRTHDDILKRERWIVDGFGPGDSIERRAAAADTIIFSDYPLWRSYLWAYKRQIEYAFRPRPELPPDCPMLPKSWELAQVMWLVHKQYRPRIFGLLEQYWGQKYIIRLTSPHETERWLQAIVP